MPKNKIKKAYLGKAIRQPTETDNEFKIRHENHTPFSDKYYSSMGLEDEKLQPGKTKIIKAQLGRIIKDNLSPQQRAQLDAYKKTVVDERFNKANQEQRDSYRKRMQEYQAEREVSRMPRQSSAMEESSRMPRQMPEEFEGYISEAERRMMQDNMPEMKKGGMTKSQKKVGSVMREFKSGKLHSGKKGPVVKNPKQAIAIALSEAGQSKKMNKGGMVRGSGVAIRGTKFKGIF